MPDPVTEGVPLTTRSAKGPAIEVEQRERACPVCGASRARLRRLYGWMFRFPQPLHVVTCAECGMTYSSHLLAVPPAEFYTQDYSEQYRYAEIADARCRELFDRVRSISDQLPSRTILDVGCATGELLQLAKAEGWAVQGTEPSQWAAAEASRRLGGHVVHVGTLDETFADLAPAAVVHASHVLEHVSDVVQFLDRMAALVLPGGAVVIEVPSELFGAATIWDWLRGRYRYAVPNLHHTNFFDAKTLGSAMSAVGLDARVQACTPAYYFGTTNSVKRTLKRLAFGAATLAKRGACLEAIAFKPHTAE